MCNMKYILYNLHYISCMKYILLDDNLRGRVCSKDLVLHLLTRLFIPVSIAFTPFYFNGGSTFSL